MTDRDLHANTQTALQANHVIPVLIGRFDILDDPVTAWTGPGLFAPTGTGDAAMDGQTFQPILPVFEISDIQESQSLSGPMTITLSGHDLDATLLRQVIRDRRQWRGRKVWLWSGLLVTTDEKTVVTNPYRIRTGVMAMMESTINSGGAGVVVTIDDDLGGAKGAPMYWLSHSRYFPADKWSEYLIKLANKPRGLDANSVTSTVGVSSGNDVNPGSGMRLF